MKAYFLMILLLLVTIVLPFVVKAANAMTAAGNAL